MNSMSYSSLPEIESSELKAKIDKLTIQAEEWAECTAEWQQKWEKMRTKKEKAAKEALMYREKVDSMTRQLFMWKEKYLQLEKENDRLKTQLKVLSPDGMLLLSKSPSPNEINLQKGGSVSSSHNGHTDSVFDNGCSISRKSDEGFDSASENLSPAQSVDLHTAFSLQPQLKLIEALVHRNEDSQPRKSISTSRSPSPPGVDSRRFSQSQREELTTLRQRCERLEKQLQDEKRVRLSSQVSNEASTASAVTIVHHSTRTQSPQKTYNSQIPVNSHSRANRPVSTFLPVNSSSSTSTHHSTINSKRPSSLKAGSKVTHEYITKHGKECFEEVLL
ncbi:coiled-coil domain-containing protein 102A-like isoform X2 [Dysidea avara]